MGVAASTPAMVIMRWHRREFPMTADEKLASCTTGWATMSWLRGRSLSNNPRHGVCIARVVCGVRVEFVLRASRLCGRSHELVC
jgi:hypothetical protein